MYMYVDYWPVHVYNTISNITDCNDQLLYNWVLHFMTVLISYFLCETKVNVIIAHLLILLGHNWFRMIVCVSKITTVQTTSKQKTDIHVSPLIAVPFDCRCIELRTSSLQLMTQMNRLPWVHHQYRCTRIQHGRLLLELMKLRRDVSVSHQYWSLLSSHCVKTTRSRV